MTTGIMRMFNINTPEYPVIIYVETSLVPEINFPEVWDEK